MPTFDSDEVITKVNETRRAIEANSTKNSQVSQASQALLDELEKEEFNLNIRN